MVHKLKFDVRDIPHSVRYGLSARNLWVFWKALALSWSVWVLMVYLGYFAAGDSMSGRWQVSRLLPVPEGIFFQSPAALVFLALGALAMVWIMLSAYLKVARITFEQIRGDDFFSSRDARAFQRLHWKPVLLVPVSITAGLAVIFAKLLILGLLGRIPAAGPVIVGLLAVPAWGMSLLGVLAFVAFVMAFPLVPAIVACTKGDTFEALFELFSTITSQPWRVVLYWLAGLASRMAAVGVFLLFARAALTLTALGVGTGMGDQGLGRTVQDGLHLVAPQLVSHQGSFLSPLGGMTGALSPWSGVSGWAAGLSGVAIALIVGSYWFSSCSSFWTVCYLVLRKRKDGEDLLQRADDEEFREFEKRYGSADQAGDGDRGE